MTTSAPELVRVLGALADDTRWQILDRLGTSAASASALAQELPVTRQAIARHLTQLQDVGLVTPVRAGREIRWTATADRLVEVGDQLRAVADGWTRRLQTVKRLAEAADSDPDPDRSG
ncbi:ArsR/SmtB family transcription factor [Nakamurella leprariae]|uniref:Helix-turn-helix transcriptional regulator n=1 Tax=Nakamurella leprariae TaxID=2803911 RepID=A0A938YHH5_9ACTN|nr:metalloregulator ArsR/SmtB family transcription factor [Nakamurella leprariae]MBM9468224.1 helix-turn-helix transcriptional regulator [Nakamurella leprariae]